MVIETERNRTLVLRAAHLWPEDSERSALIIEGPSPDRKSARHKATLVKINRWRDLALVRVDWGPWPYVAPVATGLKAPASYVSAGYDAPSEVEPEQESGLGKLHRRSARIVPAMWREVAQDRWTYTDPAPWHGRSGGGLIDELRGVTVAICSGYMGVPNRGRPSGTGIDCSLRSIREFLTDDAEPKRADPRLLPTPRIREEIVSPYCPG